MLKKLLVIFFFSCSFLIKAQVDSSAISGSKKNDSKNQTQDNSPPALGEVFKPKIALGVGMLSFHGDLYAKHFQAPWTGRIGYDLGISQRLFKPLQLNFNIMFGKLGANEWLNNRQENFEAEIRSGGLSLLYDFGNFIPDRCRVRPWVSAGVSSFEFLSKTDLRDKNGNLYYYWSDGSIKNMAETDPNAANAVNLTRDYYYETDVRERNVDGFGKYQERAWAFPVGAGALMKVTDRFDFKIGLQYYMSTTDYIDGITNNSLGTRTGTKMKDNFVYTSFALQYDLVMRKKTKADTLPDTYYDTIDWLAIDKDDYDGDGVRDWDDKCHGTPKGVKVDEFGCPFDDDKDGVANHADDEADSPQGFEVNMHGVALTDEYWQNWYDVYMDSIGALKETQVVENFYKLQKDSADAAIAAASNGTVSTTDGTVTAVANGTTTSVNNGGVSDVSNKESNKIKTSHKEQLYTIELGRYNGPVPNEEMANLLSIGDVKSTILPDNTTVVYTAGTYKEIVKAKKRRDDFRKEGNTKAEVSYFKDGDLIRMTDEEIAKLIKSKTGTESSSVSTNAGGSMEEEFAKGEIVYRVQLGAFRHRISKGIFKNAGSILELKSDENLYRYATRGFKSIEGAAALKADLVVEGYSDAFITAYKDGKRIPLSETKATVVSKEKEDLTENKIFSSIDKSLITFKVQLGALRKAGNIEFEERIKELNDVEKQSTGSGMIRYTSGSFGEYSKADKHREELADKGFSEAFVIAVFKGEIISIQEALELLK